MGYSVQVAGFSVEDAEPIDQLLDRFVEAVIAVVDGPSSATNPVMAWGGLAGGPILRLSVDADSQFAHEIGVSTFEHATEKAGLGQVTIASVEVTDEALLERQNSQPSETFVGVSEIAELLGVSRQRASMLQTRKGFPAPVADLASGPIWKRSSLDRFVETWDRKPGRPSKA